mmetsp:Transcript_95364/g.199513  ORF Transcript_95364/g.199513 Transcript_95364/m.199513 type:complete len:744 (-) Transcript_95364:46-2277(-)
MARPSNLFLIGLLAQALFAAIEGAAEADDQLAAATELVERVAGKDRADRWFKVQLIEKDPVSQGDLETMSLRAQQGKVVLGGTTAVAVASALNWYLNDFLNTTYDWSTYEALFPEELPLPPSLNRTRLVKYSYHLNVCTYGYTLVWADWNYWQKHIDWMAMQGINLPLAFLGQEKVFLNTFSKFNISFEDMQQFISGPAFLPWFRMGNLEAWGGPITNSWIDMRVDLQKQVLQRMRSLGMRPVLPAFAGFVPPAFAQKYPKAQITKSADWNNFPKPFGSVEILAPLEPLFQDVGKVFIEEQTRLYGTDHIYQCDSYNEMDPPTADHKFLASSSKAVYSAMKAADSEAVWLMQGWLFLSKFWEEDRIEAYLSGVPNEGMIILDLASEAYPQWIRTKGYFGKPWIFNTLLNYGGQQGLIGNLSAVQSGFLSALSKYSSNLVGVGITMEGMWQNYIVYDYTLSMGWQRPTLEVSHWAELFGARRYGMSGGVSEEASQFWKNLYTKAYNRGGGPRSGQIASRPTLKVGIAPRSDVGGWMKLWKQLFQLAKQVNTSQAYRFDLVDVGREALTASFDADLESFRQAVADWNTDEVVRLRLALIQTIESFDRLLSTDANFMLGRWLKMARECGSSIQDADRLEWNARNQLTLWGPTGEIVDYATKSWGGLARSYFQPRWNLFFEQVVNDVSSHSNFNQTFFNAEVLRLVEQPWQHDLQTFSSKPEEDAINVASELLQRYATMDTPKTILV